MASQRIQDSLYSINNKAGILVTGIALDPWMICVARAAVEAGLAYRLEYASHDSRSVDTDEADCLKWLSEYPEIAHSPFILGAAIEDQRFLSAFVSVRGCHGPAERSGLLRRGASASSKSMLFRLARGGLIDQLKQLIKELRSQFFSHFNSIWTEDISFRSVRRLLFRDGGYFGVFPHTRCLASSALLGRMSQSPRGYRDALFNYAGTANQNRDPVTTMIERQFILLHSPAENGRYRLRSDGCCPFAIWHNDRPGSSRPRGFEDYIQMLSSSWFTLCLPGHTGITHRVFEALNQGSIPVLLKETAVYHDLDLVDGVNSILVKDGDWRAAMLRITSLGMDQLLRMNREIQSLVTEKASSQRIFSRLMRRLLPSADNS